MLERKIEMSEFAELRARFERGKDLSHEQVLELLAEAEQLLASQDAESRIGRLPATPIMRWLEHTGGPIKQFSQSMMLQVPANLDKEQLTAALQAVLDRHDALRLQLVSQTEACEWGFEIRATDAALASRCVKRVEIADLSEEAWHACVAEQARAAIARLNPEDGTMMQAVWFYAGVKRPGRLLLVIHHLAVDGVSWRILVPDLMTAWDAIASSRQPEFLGRGTSFRYWAEKLAAEARNPERVKELPIWIATLSEATLPISDQLLDLKRDTVGSANCITRVLPAAVTNQLVTTVPAAFNGRINDVLLTSLVITLARWRKRRGKGGSYAVLIDLEGHGREEIFEGIDLSRTVGWFTSLYPVRLDPGPINLEEAWEGGTALGRALKNIKEQLRLIPDSGLGYGLLRYLNEEAGSDLADLPTPQIAFNYLGRFVLSGSTDWETTRESSWVGSGGDAEMPLTHCVEVNAATIDL